MPDSLRSFTILAGLLATQAFAQSPADLVAAKSRFHEDSASCLAAPLLADDRGTCMKEARNTLAEIRRGRMAESWQVADFEKNALARCDVHQGDDKAACLSRMRGLGRTDGSVAGGGILRELTTTVVTPPAPQPEPVKAPPAERPSGLMSNCRWVPPTDWVCK